MKSLYVVVCEDGSPYADSALDMPVVHSFTEHAAAEESLAELRLVGWDCKCKKHKIVEYVPKP